MLDQRKKELQAEIEAKQKELEEIELQEFQEYKEETEQKRRDLLKQLEDIEKQIDACEKEEQKKREELCKKYGHYLVSHRRYLADTGKHSFMYGSVSIYKVNERCLCCKYSRSYTTQMSDRGARKNEYSEQKKAALENLKNRFSKKKETLFERKRKIEEKLNELCEAYIDRVLGVFGMRYGGLEGDHKMYLYGTERDAKEIRDKWFTV